MDVEIVDTGLKRDSCGRRIESEVERERLLAAYDVSGLTQKAFAEREGITYSTFIYWLRQRRQKSRSDASTQAVNLFQEVSLSPSLTAVLEVILPDGMVLRGGDAESLAVLAKALGC
ncbi:MAG: hypothetical protein AAFX93_20175 [Verrucomicrobiota bacterium]